MWRVMLEEGDSIWSGSVGKFPRELDTVGKGLGGGNGSTVSRFKEIGSFSPLAATL